MKDQDAWRSPKAALRDFGAHQPIAERLRPEEVQKILPPSYPQNQWCKEAAALCLEVFHLLGITAKRVFLRLAAERIFERGTALRDKK